VTTRTGAELVDEALRALGVDTVFGIVSIHNVPILDALRRGGEIRFITTRHEQAAVHAADAYARVTGRLGVALASTGPGTANAVAGMYEAASASSPVLLLTGQVPSSYYGAGRGYLHEAEQQVPMLRAVTRRVESVRRADDIGELVVRAGRDAVAGRPLPTAVEIPIDLQQASVRARPPVSSAIVPAEPTADSIRRAAEVIASSPKRVVWAGGGVVRGGASAELVHLAETLDAPVVTTRSGRGAIPDDHPLAIGPLVATPVVAGFLAEADVLIAVGTRFRSTDTRDHRLRLPRRIVQVDVDAAMIERSYRVEARVVGDACQTLPLLAEVSANGSGEATLGPRAPFVRAEAVALLRSVIGPDFESALDELTAVLPSDTPIVLDTTVPAFTWAMPLLPVQAPRRVVYPTSDAIGPGLPFAVGAAVATGQPTLLIVGDGGLMLHIGEFATAVDNR
jgi:acetolactate synthase-1/2/3 large subunit